MSDQYFIIYTTENTYGIGLSKEEASSDALSNLGETFFDCIDMGVVVEFEAHQCSQQVYAKVQNEGGFRVHDECLMVRGVVVLKSEITAIAA